MTKQNNDNHNHRPNHLYIGHTYFVSGRCYEGVDYFNTDERKIMFQNRLKDASERFQILLYAWSVLDNHYHLLFSIFPTKKGSNEINRGEFTFVDQLNKFRAAQFVTPNKQERSNEMSKANFVINTKYILTEFIRKLHKDNARIINHENNSPGRKIWYQYWDYCIRNKPDFWKHFNYIIQQPLKHNKTKTLNQAYSYIYSSNRTWLERFGVAGLSESFEKYPVLNWTPNNLD